MDEKAVRVAQQNLTTLVAALDELQQHIDQLTQAPTDTEIEQAFVDWLAHYQPDSLRTPYERGLYETAFRAGVAWRTTRGSGS